MLLPVDSGSKPLFPNSEW